ncbi:MAG: hypothetical protein KF720_21635, partial [Rubrivivax sp.]|nr:hypothetical protein [Rubrivivax sp.]
MSPDRAVHGALSSFTSRMRLPVILGGHLPGLRSAQKQHALRLAAVLSGRGCCLCGLGSDLAVPSRGWWA